jgi:glucose/arabinose dehydrogenase
MIHKISIMPSKYILALAVLLPLAWSCNTTFIYKDQPLTAKEKADSMAAYGLPSDSLANPYATKSVYNFSSVQGWENGNKPVAPDGFTVSLFAADLDRPRWIYEMPNGDIIVAESKADRLKLLRDMDADGTPDTSFIFKEDLDKPLGMLYLNGYFYIANTGELLRYKYGGNGALQGDGENILNLPANGYNAHWTRNLIASPDGSKIYVTVGSASNVAEGSVEAEKRRANIIEINPDGSGERIYASGLRNPVGMDWHPETGELWTAVNERDALGDNLVPDYITSVKDGGFYGWPYLYFGNNIDPRWKDDLPTDLPPSIKPDFAVGAHTASLGIAFGYNTHFPEKYKNGAYVAQHGSWNRTTLNGYTVLFIPFKGDKPTGKVEKFLTGFISDLKDEKVYGRPVGVFVLKDGSLLVTDDGGGAIWKIKAK